MNKEFLNSFKKHIKDKPSCVLASMFDYFIAVAKIGDGVKKRADGILIAKEIRRRQKNTSDEYYNLTIKAIDTILAKRKQGLTN